MFAYSITGWRGYAVAAGLVGLATLLRFLIGLWFGEGVLYYGSYYPVVVLVTLISGFRAGAFAWLLSVLIVWFFFIPPHLSLQVKEPIAYLNLALFSVSSALLIFLSHSYRALVERMQTEATFRELLLDEVRHRSRNSVAVAKTIVDNSLKADPQTAATINGRLATLLSADALLMENASAGERLQTILNNELGPYGSERVVATGTDVFLPARHARAWALIVHELATNAAKYGALRHDGGQVLITWLRSGENLDFWWVETGAGDAPPPLANGGFGTRLIDAMVKSLGGTIRRSMEPVGLKCAIEVPLKEFEPSVRTQATAQVVQPAASGPAPRALQRCNR